MEIPTDTQMQQIASRIGEVLKTSGQTLATAESCTGGWVAKVITDIPGSSQWFDRGFVTYTNKSKQDMLDVSALTLQEHGAVSEDTVREMAAGAVRHSQAGISLAISGIAGPGGATIYKPVGTVCFAWCFQGQIHTATTHFSGNRQAVRAQAVVHALQELDRFLHERQ